MFLKVRKSLAAKLSELQKRTTRALLVAKWWIPRISPRLVAMLFKMLRLEIADFRNSF
jgi:hypothetical protein